MQFILFLILSLAALLLVLLTLIHLGFRAPRLVESGDPSHYGLPYREVSIPTVRGKRLFGWFIPVETTAPTVIILHGWGANAELMLPLAAPLHKAGFNVLTMDARGHGRSDGDTFSSLPRFAEDLGCAIDWLKAYSDTPSIALLGHSVGAGAVLLEASRRKDISAVVSVSAFAHPEWMMQRYLNRFHTPRLLSYWIIRYVEWVIGHQYEAIAPMNTARRLGCPVLLVHGKADKVVPVEDAHVIHKNAGSERVELLLVDDAGHESVDKIEEQSHHLTGFLSRVMPPAPSPL